jgi:hypothetical protein
MADVDTTYVDEELGTFTFDPGEERFSAAVTWMDDSVDLNLEASTSEAMLEALVAARMLWQDQATWSQRVGAFAVAKLCALKNSSWREGDDPEVSEADFLAAMSLVSITVAPDGSFDFWHSDGDLFWGHSIQVSGSLSEGPQIADIPG